MDYTIHNEYNDYLSKANKLNSIGTNTPLPLKLTKIAIKLP